MAARHEFSYLQRANCRYQQKQVNYHLQKISPSSAPHKPTKNTHKRVLLRVWETWTAPPLIGVTSGGS